MSAKQGKQILLQILRVVLPLACALWIAFIFGNSLRTGAESTEQSSAVVDLVQDMAGIFAPDGFIATAKGEDYERLQGIIRTLAHFSEFAVLGVLLCWTYFAYQSNPRRLWIPVLFGASIPLFDELVQSFIPGRAASWLDITVDIFGEAVGFLIAWLLWRCLCKLYQKRAQKCENKE